jgi:hypothetical protein
MSGLLILRERFSKLFCEHQAVSRRFASEVKEILSQRENAGEYMGVVSGCLQLVGVTKAGRENSKAADLDPYTILHEAAIDTLSTFQVEKALRDSA